MGDTYAPERHPQHECPALCFVCGRGLSMFERFVRQQFAGMRSELVTLVAEVDELRQEVQQLAVRCVNWPSPECTGWAEASGWCTGCWAGIAPQESGAGRR
ncbi:MAG TPA: hypothetical protein VF482_13600, partial [Trebonia sp.]